MRADPYLNKLPTTPDGIPILGDEDTHGHTFRGAALGNPFDPNDPVDPLMEYVMADWFVQGGREYPPFYYHAMTK